MWKLTPREQKLLFFVGLLIVVGLVLRFTLPDPSQEADISHDDRSGEYAGVEFIAQDSAEEEDMIFVHVVGGVHKPGVYQLPEGSRVFEVIEMAGGVLQEELLEYINLAQPLYDGQQLIVPHDIEEAENNAASQSGMSGGLININRASKEELESLPGIGPVKAEDIIKYREENGPFKDIRDLTQVKGIGAKTLENIASYITVY